MTRFPYDQFAKDYLQELLQPFGEIETSRKVPAEIREIDVYFAPTSPSTSDKLKLGLLGKIASTPALIEPFRNAAKIAEIRSCLNNLFDIFAAIKREAKDLIMRLSPIYEQKLAEAKQEGIREGIQEGIQEGLQAERRNVINNLLQFRFGTVDTELAGIIEPLLALSPEEFTPLLLQLSREELLDRFL